MHIGIWPFLPLIITSYSVPMEVFFIVSESWRVFLCDVCTIFSSTLQTSDTALLVATSVFSTQIESSSEIVTSFSGNESIAIQFLTKGVSKLSVVSSSVGCMNG